MKLSSFSKLFNTLYTDKFSVYRYKEVEEDDGSTYIEEQLTPVYDGKNCRISYGSSDNPETNKEDTNPLYLQVKIFCDTEIAVKKGDKIKAQRLSDNGTVLAEYEGIASAPLQYVTHKEFLIVQDGDA